MSEQPEAESLPAKPSGENTALASSSIEVYGEPLNQRTQLSCAQIPATQE
jgi:hypothetical protein